MNADELAVLRAVRSTLGECSVFDAATVRELLDIADGLVNEIEALSAENADLAAVVASQRHHDRVLTLARDSLHPSVPYRFPEHRETDECDPSGITRPQLRGIDGGAA